MAHCTLRLLAVLLATASVSLAQSLPDWAAPETPSPVFAPDSYVVPDAPNGGNAPAIVPVDGGLSLLALAGGAYAAARLRRRGD